MEEFKQIQIVTQLFSIDFENCIPDLKHKMKNSMKLKIIILFAIFCTGCATQEYDLVYSTVTITPSISPDGKKTFIAVASNKLPGFAKNQTLEDFHKQLIPAEMGRLNFCTKGYDVDYANPKIDSYAFVYNGECK